MQSRQLFRHGSACALRQYAHSVNFASDFVEFCWLLQSFAEVATKVTVWIY